MEKMKLGVIFGGMSTEHDISIVSGSSVLKNLNKEKYDITAIYIDEKGESDLAKTLGENKDEFEQQKSTEVHSESDEDKSDSEEEEDFRNDEI